MDIFIKQNPKLKTILKTIIFLIFILPVKYAAQEQQNKYVLVLKSKQEEFSWTNPLINSFIFSLENKLPQIKTEAAGVNFNLFNKNVNNKPEKEFVEKYSLKRPDLIVSTDDHSFRFLLKYKELFFPDTPLLIAGVTDTSNIPLIDRNSITGIIEKVSLQPLIESALILHPQIKRAIVFFDNTNIGKLQRKLFDNAVPYIKTAVDFESYENVNISELDSMNINNRDAIVFLFGLLKNSGGDYISPRESALILTRKFEAPVYSSWSSTLNYGIVGCLQIKTYQQGALLANIASRILNGEKISQIPLLENQDFRLLFDYVQLKRFNVNFTELPIASVVVNKPVSFYSEYKEYIWTSLAVFIILLSAILFLVRDIKKRSRVENELKISEEKLRNFIEQSTDGISLIDEKGIIIGWNRGMEKMTGLKQEDVIFKSNWEIQKIIFQQINNDIINEQNYRQEVVEFFETGIAPSINKIHDVEIIHKKGNIIFAQLLFFPVKTENGFMIGSIARDVTSLKVIEVNLKESEEKYRTLIENLNEGICVVGLDKKFIYANKSAQSIFGLKPENYPDYSIEDFLSDEEKRKFKSFMQRSIKGESVNSEIEVFKKSGEKRDIMINLTPYLLTYGNKSGIYIVFVDLTERKKAESELIRAKEAAERSDKLKSEFLAQMSHEIRTPINAILSFSSLLKSELENNVDDEIKSSFRIIDSGGRRLIRTIDLILNMSQLQTGNFETNPRKINLQKEILDLLKIEFANIAKERNLEFIVKNENVSEPVLCDSYTVIQMLSNLIDNAIKYTPKGKVELNLNKNTEGEICFEVKDTGIGISEEFRENIFNPFTQEETGYTRKFEGTGLGLALVKKYAELNNAEIEVSSEKGKGSTFKIVFKKEKFQSEPSANSFFHR